MCRTEGWGLNFEIVGEEEPCTHKMVSHPYPFRIFGPYVHLNLTGVMASSNDHVEGEDGNFTEVQGVCAMLFAHGSQKEDVMTSQSIKGNGCCSNGRGVDPLPSLFYFICSLWGKASFPLTLFLSIWCYIYITELIIRRNLQQ
jgi:hypothetical protein